jgi:hypothetical protein
MPDQDLVDPGNRWEATDIYNLNSGALTSSFPPSNFLLLSPHLILTLGRSNPRILVAMVVIKMTVYIYQQVGLFH